MKKLVALFLTLILLCSNSIIATAKASDIFDNYTTISSTLVRSMDYSAKNFYESTSSRALFTILASCEVALEFNDYLIDVSTTSYVGYNSSSDAISTIFSDGEEYVLVVYFSDVPDLLFVVPTGTAYTFSAANTISKLSNTYEENEKDDLVEIAKLLRMLSRTFDD